MASPGNTKGMSKAAAARKSSKAGFDTYDDNISDSVTVIKQGSQYDSNAKRNIRDMQKSIKKNDKDMNNYAVSRGAKVQAELSSKDPSMKGYYKDIDIAEKSKAKPNRNGESFSFFKHTQKDNK